MEEAKIIRFLIRRITFFRNLIFILDGSEVILFITMIGSLISIFCF